MIAVARPAGERRVLPRLARVLRWEGVAGLRWRALAALGYRYQQWFARPLAEPLPVPAPPQEVELRRLGEASVREYVALRPAATAARFHARLGAGHSCFGARVDGRLLAVHWVATGSAWSDYLGCRHEFAADEIYVYDVYTSPLARGQRLQDLSLRRSLSDNRERGAAWALALIVPENRPSVRCFTRLGFRRAGSIATFHIGPWRWQREHGSRRPPAEERRGWPEAAPGGP